MKKARSGGVARCEYCGKKLVVQDEFGANADGNRVVLEIDGTQKRACRSCAERMSGGAAPPSLLGDAKSGRKLEPR